MELDPSPNLDPEPKAGRCSPCPKAGTEVPDPDPKSGALKPDPAASGEGSTPKAIEGPAPGVECEPKTVEGPAPGGGVEAGVLVPKAADIEPEPKAGACSLLPKGRAVAGSWGSCQGPWRANPGLHLQSLGPCHVQKDWNQG